MRRSIESRGAHLGGEESRKTVRSERADPSRRTSSRLASFYQLLTKLKGDETYVKPMISFAVLGGASLFYHEQKREHLTPFLSSTS